MESSSKGHSKPNGHTHYRCPCREEDIIEIIPHHDIHQEMTGKLTTHQQAAHAERRTLWKYYPIMTCHPS